MGTDIHLQVEKRIDGQWTHVPTLPPRTCSWCDGKGTGHEPGGRCYWCKGTGADVYPYEDRSYAVFSKLAGVRNADDTVPIDVPRGLPSDRDRNTIDARYPDERPYEYGDHSYSWLTLAELLAHDWTDINAHFVRFLRVLEKVGEPDDVRIVFGFDS